MRWRGSDLQYPNTPPELGLTFSPRLLHHNLNLPAVYEGSAPNRLYILVCDLVDVELPDREISPQYVLVRLLQSK